MFHWRLATAVLAAASLFAINLTAAAQDGDEDLGACPSSKDPVNYAAPGHGGGGGDKEVNCDDSKRAPTKKNTALSGDKKTTAASSGASKPGAKASAGNSGVCDLASRPPLPTGATKRPSKKRPGYEWTPGHYKCVHGEWQYVRPAWAHNRSQ